jgi:hypothetical protein
MERHMGDDNEVRQLIRRESETFLQKALTDTKGVVKKYDFETEFANTRKNRSPVVVVVTIATIVALGLAAWGVTLLIQRQSRSAPVDVRAFNDLNLKDLLDTSKRNSDDLSRAQQELARISDDYRAANDAADRTYASAVESIKASNFPPAQEKRELDAASAARADTRKKLSASYVPASAALKKQMADIQTRIDSYDKRMMDQAKQQQTLLDSERRLADIEMKKQADIYEARLADLKAARSRDLVSFRQQRDDLRNSLTARWNPVFDDDRSKTLIGNWSEPKGPKAAFPAIPPYLEDRGIMARGSSAQLDQSHSDLLYLVAKLRAIPYMNSVPATLSRIENEIRTSITSYRGALAGSTAGLQDRDEQIANLNQQVADRDRQIENLKRQIADLIADRDRQIADLNAQKKAVQQIVDRYRWAVGEYLGSTGESGYIIDASDPANVVLELNPAVTAGDGSNGYVVRNGQVIANLSFFAKDGAVLARIVGMSPAAKDVRPFDIVLLSAAGEGQAAAQP